MEIFFTEFNLLKSIISSVVVLILIFISERNPKLGGLLAGLPIGTGIVIYFYAIEQNIDFVIKGIPFGIAGLVSSLAFTIGFYLGGKMNSKTPIISTLFSSVFGILMFFLVSFSLIHLNINLSTSLFNFLIGLIISVLSFRNIKNNIEITPKKNTITTVLFRFWVVS